MKTQGNTAASVALQLETPYAGESLSDTGQVDYALFCANLWHFYPRVAPIDYPRLYREVLAMQRHAALADTRGVEVPSAHEALRAQLARLQKEPGIICTYHTGAYRQANRLLARAGIPFTLALSTAVLAREGESMRQRYAALASPAGPGGFDLLDAESPTVIRAMCRALDEGRSMLLYVDGNTGAATGIARNLMELSFLNGHIQVRKGIAALSYLSKKPLYPLLSCRTATGEAYFRSFDPINPRPGEMRRAYEQRATARLYGLLENYVSEQPGDWECWRYLHHWLAKEHGTLRSGAEALHRYGERERWQAVWHQGHAYRFDRAAYRMYPCPGGRDG